LFVLEGITPSVYRLSIGIPSTLPAAYIQSIRLGSRDVLIDEFQIQGEVSEDIQVVVRTDGGVLAGRVLSDMPDPMAYATAVLVPNPGIPLRSDLYKVARTDDSGNFRMQGITPGNYKLFAWGNVEDQSWLDPEFMQLFEDRGAPIRINAGDHVKADVKLCPPWF
jgi:hypothetical protein